MTETLDPVTPSDQVGGWQIDNASTVELLNVTRERVRVNVQTYGSQPDVMREFLLAQERIEDAIDRFNHAITMAQTGYVIEDAERTLLPKGASRTPSRT